MVFSQDFLSYMEAAAPLLDRDTSIWCISSWNDNGLNHLDWQNDKLVSFFPSGLACEFHEPLLETLLKAPLCSSGRHIFLAWDGCFGSSCGMK